MFHFAGANTECKRTECAVCCGVAVAADNGHARKRATLLGANDVHDALLFVAHWVQRDVELFCVRAHHFKLLGRNWVGNWQVNVGGGNVVVFGRHGEIWSAHGAVINTKAIECLRAGYFMDQMQVDVQQIRFADFA